MDELLANAVDRAAPNVYAGSFQELRTAFRETYGDRSWMGKLATAMSGKMPPSQTGLTKGSAEYKRAEREYNSARRTVERYEKFQKDPTNKNAHNPANAPKVTREQFVKAGKTVEPLRRDVPPGGLKFKVEFRTSGESGHGSRTRTAIITMSSAAAYDFANNPSYWGLFENWFDGGGDAYGEDGDYEVDVVSVTPA